MPLKRLPIPFLLVGIVFIGGAGPAFGWWRATVAFLVAALIVWLGVSYFRSAGQAPPDVAGEEVADDDLRYLCSMCGLELKVLVATNDRPPTHCREKMRLVDRTGKPVLKPV
jgi:divalent metal cation (Fe/Co/Zn/Cd) transporter